MKNKEQISKYREMNMSDLYVKAQSLVKDANSNKINDEQDAHLPSKRRKDIARIKTVISEKKILNNE